MRDLATRVPVHVRDQLGAAVATLAEHAPPVMGALHDLGRYGLLADLAMQIPGSLAPDELAEPSDDESEAAAEALRVELGWHIAYNLDRAIRAAECPSLPT